MANSVDPDQTAPIGAVCSGSTLFASILYSSVMLGNYEGCSNMNASSFITFVTYMLRQNGKRFYKVLYVTFNLAPVLKKKYGILIEL